jgi:hypothetical protein
MAGNILCLASSVEVYLAVACPLNSRKMTSSMREPVSMRAVAMMVRLPPFFDVFAAPKKRLGFLHGRRVDAAGE